MNMEIKIKKCDISNNHLHFRKEYKKVYKGILLDEILEQGNPWMEDFIEKCLEAQKKEFITHKRCMICGELDSSEKGFCEECLKKHGVKLGELK